MYQPSQDMPLESFQVISPCENQTDFRAGQIMRFLIPRSIGFWDPHTSRLQLEVSAQNNNYKMCFAHSCGAASLIDMVRVSQNGIVISETTEYATLNNLFTLYSDSLSIRQRNSVQNGARDYVGQFGDGTQYPGGADGAAVTNSPLRQRDWTQGAILGEPLNGNSTSSTTEGLERTPKKYQLELRGIGLFELLEVVPSVALGDILIEIRLVSNNRDALIVHPATARPITVATMAGAQTTITLSPPFVGFNNLADSPLVTGMRIDAAVDATGVPLGTAGDTRIITALSQADDTGVITITPNAALAAAFTTSTIVITEGTRTVTGPGGAAAAPANLVNLTPATSFVVSRASMLLQVIRPPVQYLESISAKVQEGLMLDLNTYTTYRSSIQTGIRQATLDIPAMMSRAKAIFTVPRQQTQGEFGANYSSNNLTASNLMGQYDGLLRYRTQIGELYYPNQPVQLDQFVKPLNARFSAQHIVELEKALEASIIPMRSLKSCKQCFVIPRVLAKYGASVNLEKGVRLYLEYNQNGPQDPQGNAVSLDAVTFVNHINRIMITPAGIQVLS